jgi:glutaminase
VHVNVPVLMEERAASGKNLAIAHLLRNFDLIQDPEAALDLFLAQCSIELTTRSLARIAGTLACGGRNPITGQQVFAPRDVERALSMMTTCGLNNGSGQFSFHTGLPAKSGISGCILAVAPGRLGLAVHSPAVDGQGNSVRGVRALLELSRSLGLSAFAVR